jgi:hypothetical protein
MPVQSFTMHTGAPLVMMENGTNVACLSPPQPGDLLCMVENGGEGEEPMFIHVGTVISTTPVTYTPASFIEDSFIPNGAVPEDCDVQVNETRGPIDTTKIKVSLLSSGPLTLAVYSDEKGGYVNVVLTD